MKRLICLSLIFTIILTGCYQINISDDYNENNLKEIVIPEYSHSEYGYNSLNVSLKRSYEDILNGIYTFQEEIVTPLIDESSICEVIKCIKRDYPTVFWLDNQYYYTMNKFKKTTTIHFNYTADTEYVKTILEQIDKEADIILANCPPNATDFEKALYGYDKLINLLQYDDQSENQRELYGAILEQKATCEGYSKAYQYILLKMGLDALIVYGTAGESHAWNIVKIEDQYYHSDLTFGDRRLDNGQHFVSHEFFLVEDESFYKTHIPYDNSSNYQLPSCNLNSNNYFVKKELVLNSTEKKEVQEVIKKAASEMINNVFSNYHSIQFKVKDNVVAEEIINQYINTGEFDRILKTLPVFNKGKIKPIGYNIDENTNVMTYIIV